MPDDTLSLTPVYQPGGALCGEAPEYYRVTAKGGAITIDCPTEAEALRYFTRWAESEA
jgi:hypothetical protein